MGTPTLSELIARLLKERIVFIGTPIDDAVATETVANLLFGHRAALPNARIGFDELWGGSTSSPRQAQEIARLRTEFIQQMAKDTGRLPGLIEGDMKRGCRMTATEALDYGIIDTVVEKLS
ncbi:MAG: ATP-dependent Clp protease proteolytic subunit [Planctomycetes bacterium]|nr:ATP-dependent Clp protease proteolytic subunit [Planctomycetota bacterium]